MSKYRTTILAAALLFAASSAFADDAVRTYGRVLAEAGTVEQKYAIATSIAALNDPDAARYVADALDWALATRGSSKTGPEREIYERLSRTLLKLLGDWRYTNAASSVMRAVDDSPDPLTKAEALIALGSMRAVEYAERVSCWHLNGCALPWDSRRFSSPARAGTQSASATRQNGAFR